MNTPAPMIAGLPGLAAALALVMAMIAFYERKPSTWHLAAAAYGLIFGVIFLFVPSLWFTLCLSLGFLNLIGLASMAKYRSLGFNLVAGDIRHHFLMAAWTVWSDYRRSMVYAAIAAAALVLAAAGLERFVGDFAAPLPARIGVFLLSLLIFGMTFVLSGGRRRFRVQLLTENRAHVSAFVASLFGAGPENRLQMSDIAADALPLAPPIAGRFTVGRQMPDIYLVLSESTFDPRAAGFPTPGFAKRFFNPDNAISGVLHVDVFGGSTWQSEFSVYAGLSSKSFGVNSRFVFQLLKDRVKHSLPACLNRLGYNSMLISSDGSAANPLVSHRDFYRSIGFSRIEYPVDWVNPAEFRKWKRERHDEQTYACALSVRSEELAKAAPLFLSVMTYINHGDHLPRRFASALHAAVRSDALAQTGSVEYAEYCVRLAESVRAYDAFRAAIEKDAAARPALIIRYGDHQPSFMAKLLNCQPTDPRLHKTYYSIEGIGLPLTPVDFNTDELDAAMLSAVALASAGMPLDAIDATRLAVAADCGPDYFSSNSDMKHRFHRSLLETGNLLL